MSIQFLEDAAWASTVNPPIHGMSDHEEMGKITKVVKVFVGGSDLPFSFDLDEWNEKQMRLFKENYFKPWLELHGSEGAIVYINIRRIDAVQIE